MNSKILILTTLAIATFVVGGHAAEKSRFGANASEWSSTTVPVPGVIIPVGGSGQVNGDFVLGERNGVEIGIRAQRRFLQNVDPLENHRDGQVGVYAADTGVSDGQGRATWNYDIHVDLRGAKGVAKGTTLGDY